MEIMYSEWGYEIFTSIEKHCRTMYGYGTYPDVTKEGLKPEDQMESFFPAETLKYLYLLFKPSPLIDFDKVVFKSKVIENAKSISIVLNSGKEDE